MSEAFYTSSSQGGFSATSPPSTSPTSSAPPPPPPKPISQSADPSRSGTPIHSFVASSVAAPGTSFQSPGPAATNSPRPQPPLPISTPSTPTPQAAYQSRQYTPIPPPTLQDRWIPPQIADKPINELQTLVNNQTLLASLASTHPSYASSLVPLQDAIQANVQTSQQISQLEAQLRKLRDETAQLLLNHTSLQNQWRRKQSEMDDALSPWGPRQMYQRLLSGITEQESVLKAMQESFLEGSNSDDGYYGSADGKASEKEVTEWVRRIREGATTLEKRREMRARWDEGRVGGWR
ncbi:hypothetical protein LTR84_010307 [Exophiala bonariae]|uniref:VPS37 C-terminal domain-containing protein n=1 Tax=Exophiala bonariae TaxID=1690606 RepID=A0AAV9MVG7_9EURO|nr:hypothetical protein LTR84_010307 [Exophiala bonariae]